MSGILSEIKLDKKYIKLWIELCVFSLFYVLPVMIINIRYNDDLGIAWSGISGLRGDGRPVGDKLVSIVSGGGIIADVAPLPLLMAIAFLSYAAVFYVQENLYFFENLNGLVLALILIITNPLIVSNLYYRSGGMVMIIAMALPFILFSWGKRVNIRVQLVVSFGFGIIIMSLYQPCIGECLVFTMIDIIIYFLYNKNRLKEDLVKLSGILISCIFYLVVVMPKYIDNEGWRYEASKTIDGISRDTLVIIWNNLLKSIDCIYSYFRGLTKAGILCEVLLFGGASLILAIRLGKVFEDNRIKKIIAILIGIVINFVMVILSFLPLVVLSSLAIKSRIFMGIGVVMFWMGIILIEMMPRFRYIICCSFLALILFRFSYMYTLANTINAENESEKYLAYNIAYDIERVNSDGNYLEYSFIGKAPTSKSYELMTKKYSNFPELIPVYFYNDSWIGSAWIDQYLHSKIVNVNISDGDMEAIEKKQPVVNNSIYRIFVSDEGKLLIAFND